MKIFLAGATGGEWRPNFARNPDRDLANHPAAIRPT